MSAGIKLPRDFWMIVQKTQIALEGKGNVSCYAKADRTYDMLLS